MAENALFRLASVTKPIVSAAALALVSQGKLSLHDPVTRWLPAFKPKLTHGQDAQITIRQLMTHTAGLTYRFFQEDQGTYERAGVSDGMDLSGISLEENLQRLASVPLLYVPGNMWRYSIATDVLGAVIEKVTGMSLREAVQLLVTHPLRMTDTDFVAVDSNRLTAAYADGSEEPRLLHNELEQVPFIEGTAGFRLAPNRANQPSAYPSGGAGMVGSTGDFLTLLETLRQGVSLFLRKLLPPRWPRIKSVNSSCRIGQEEGLALVLQYLKILLQLAPRNPRARGGWVELTGIPGLLIQKKNLVLQHSPTRHLKGCRAHTLPISVMPSTQAFVKAKGLQEFKYE